MHHKWLETIVIYGVSDGWMSVLGIIIGMNTTDG